MKMDIDETKQYTAADQEQKKLTGFFVEHEQKEQSNVSETHHNEDPLDSNPFGDVDDADRISPTPEPDPRVDDEEIGLFLRSPPGSASSRRSHQDSRSTPKRRKISNLLQPGSRSASSSPSLRAATVSSSPSSAAASAVTSTNSLQSTPSTFPDLESDLDDPDDVAGADMMLTPATTRSSDGTAGLSGSSTRLTTPNGRNSQYQSSSLQSHSSTSSHTSPTTKLSPPLSSSPYSSSNKNVSIFGTPLIPSCSPRASSHPPISSSTSSTRKRKKIFDEDDFGYDESDVMPQPTIETEPIIEPPSIHLSPPTKSSILFDGKQSAHSPSMNLSTPKDLKPVKSSPNIDPTVFPSLDDEEDDFLD